MGFHGRFSQSRQPTLCGLPLNTTQHGLGVEAEGGPVFRGCGSRGEGCVQGTVFRGPLAAPTGGQGAES